MAEDEGKGGQPEPQQPEPQRDDAQPALGLEAPRHYEAKGHPWWVRLIVVGAILGAGVLGMAGLAALRQDPPRMDPPEPVLRADAIEVFRGTHRTTLRGFGSARSARRVDLAPQVGGRVVEAHPRLEVGEVVAAGEVLVRIDPTDYEIRVEAAEAELARLEAEAARLDREELNDQRRLGIARESLGIAERELARSQELQAAGGAESESALDRERLAVKARRAEVVALENALELYESRRRALDAQLRAAQSTRRSALEDLERTILRAPFDGRIEAKMVEEGQLVQPGAVALRLADDARLEIPLPLDSREVSRWLDFEPSTTDRHWFGRPNPERRAAIRWTERPAAAVFDGLVTRVESYDAATRTFTLVVELVDEEGLAQEFPLADGMFCEIAIEGREARDVFAVPRGAIDSQGRVLLANGGRLRSRPVEVVRFQDDVAYIAEGLEDGDIVLVTRPPRVLDGIAVEVEMRDGPDASEVAFLR